MAKSHKDKSGNAKASTAGQVSSEPKLPGTREELLELHRDDAQAPERGAARERGAPRRHRPDRADRGRGRADRTRDGSAQGLIA